jgi:polyprenyl P-hydroxybenzoate/phenylacrylic acid decarboxylase-like protein
MIGIGCAIARQNRSRSMAALRVTRIVLWKSTHHAGLMLMNSPVPAQRRLSVRISGVSGVVYGGRVLQLLRNAGVENHLVMSKTAELTFAYETSLKIADVKASAHTVHDVDDMAASIASGSFRTAGMIVAPCSIRSMSEIATGVTTTVLTRAADVTLKERRRLVLMVGETPLHGGHLAQWPRCPMSARLSRHRFLHSMRSPNRSKRWWITLWAECWTCLRSM